MGMGLLEDETHRYCAELLLETLLGCSLPYWRLSWLNLLGEKVHHIPQRCLLRLPYLVDKSVYKLIGFLCMLLCKLTLLLCPGQGILLGTRVSRGRYTCWGGTIWEHSGGSR